MSSSPSIDLDRPDESDVEADITPAPTRERRAWLLADFGFADDGVLGATLYATRVLQRRLTMLLTRRRLEAELKLAQQALSATLTPLGKALCEQQDDRGLNELAPMFEAVEDARRAARDKDTAREQVRVSSANVRRDIDDGKATSEATASRFRAQESELAARETQLRTQLKRAQALTQRCEIELRAARTAAVGPDPNKVAAIVQQKAEREAEANTLNGQLTTLLGELGEVRRSLASARGVMSDLDGKQRAQQAQHQRVDRKHEKHAKRAHSQLEVALSDLAAAAVEKDLVDFTTPEGAAVAHARTHAEELQHQVDDHLAADTAYEPEPYTTGVRVLGGLAVAGVLVIVLAFRG